MLKSVVSILNNFSGPIGGLVEKGILAGVMYAIGAGWIKGDAVGIAASIYAAVSALFTAVVNTQTGKASSIVETQGNGITVVPKRDAVNAGLSSVTEPQPSVLQQ
jgi:hypothetical protein